MYGRSTSWHCTVTHRLVSSPAIAESKSKSTILKSKSIGTKSDSKSKSFQSKSESESKFSKKRTESKSRLEYKSGDAILETESALQEFRTNSCI